MPVSALQPVALKIEWGSESELLPTAATCYQAIYLPRYQSVSKLLDKMTTAMMCMSIDTDGGGNGDDY